MAGDAMDIAMRIMNCGCSAYEGFQPCKKCVDLAAALTAAKERGRQVERDALLRDPLLGAKAFFAGGDMRELARQFLDDISGFQNPEDHAALWFERAKQAGLREGIEMAKDAVQTLFREDNYDGEGIGASEVVTAIDERANALLPTIPGTASE